MPVLLYAMVIKIDAVYYGNKPERVWPIVYPSVYYNGSTEQEPKMARLHDQASFHG